MVWLPILLMTQPQQNLDEYLRAIVLRAKVEFPKLKDDEVGISVEIKNGPSGSYRGDQNMYPASVVKMFYLAYAMELFEKKKLQEHPELDRAIKDMIVDSTNEATNVVLEALTGALSGPPLPEAELKKWMYQRQAVNRWLSTLGYQNINCSQKTWNEGPYGRERQGYGPNFELRNSLNPNACVRMIKEIMTDKIVTPKRCESMRTLLYRPLKSNQEQLSGFIGGVLPEGSEIWSKAGWTSTVRHDVAHIKLRDKEMTIAIFTKYQVGESKLMQFLAREVIKL